MKNEHEHSLRSLPAETGSKNNEFSFEEVLKKNSKEIIIKNFASQLKTKPSDEQIDKASGVLNAFRMQIKSGLPSSLEASHPIDERIHAILTEPIKLNRSKRTRRSKNPSPKKAA